jgi:hypothetical protein
MLYEQGRHPRFIHANADAVAGDARLCDFESRAADLITVADTHGIVSHSFDREVLAELSVNKIGPLQLLLPIAIRFNLINEDGSLLSTMTGEIALAVANNIELVHHLPSRNWTFPDGGMDSLAVPCHVAWKTDV